MTLVAGSDTIFATGILRDFHRAEIKMNVGNVTKGYNSFDVGYNRDKMKYVTDTLGLNGKPVFASNTNPSFTAEDYYKWWNTDPLWMDRANNALMQN